MRINSLQLLSFFFPVYAWLLDLSTPLKSVIYKSKLPVIQTLLKESSLSLNDMRLNGCVFLLTCHPSINVASHVSEAIILQVNCRSPKHILRKCILTSLNLSPTYWTGMDMYLNANLYNKPIDIVPFTPRVYFFRWGDERRLNQIIM